MPKFEDLKAEYKKLWDTATIREGKEGTVAAAAAKLLSLRPHYDKVGAATRVPWYVIGLIHSLEASFRLDRHLHNGDPLSGRTCQVPADHPKSGSPPFSWEASAIDALTLKGLQNIGAWTIERICYQLEAYNGWGYRNNFPTVKSPYLWSFTNQYSKGKYVADHKFDHNAVSAQVGAMAILKKLVGDGSVSLSDTLPPPPPPKPPVPVPTGLYFASDDTPFGLRAEPRDDAARLLEVMPQFPVTKLKEDAPGWWQVEVTRPNKSKSTGFARREWFKDQTVMSTFSEDRFAETCLDSARRYGTSAHFLIALAVVESGMANVARDVGAFGPLLMTQDDWTTYNNTAETGYGDADRFDPLAQATVGARMAAKLTEAARESLPDKRLPTGEELYIARLFGAAGLKLLAEAKPDAVVRDTLVPPLAAADVDRAFALHPQILKTGVKVQDFRKQVQTELDAGFDKAVELILKVEPEAVVGPSEASADADKVPWMNKAKSELAKGVKELPGAASNPEVEKYFVDTVIGKQRDGTAWCAAFVSWCIKESGGSKKDVRFSALAADWLKNGDGLPAPQYGAVAVTKPLAPGASGHVGFVVSWNETKVKLLGGNQGDKVCEQDFRIADVRGWRMM
jgi:uncharacterized protein (TIGR02594 family)